MTAPYLVISEGGKLTGGAPRSTMCKNIDNISESSIFWFYEILCWAVFCYHCRNWNKDNYKKMKIFKILEDYGNNELWEKWEDNKKINKDVIIPSMGICMESITRVKIFYGSEYKANGKFIRWIEVFFLENDDPHSCLSDPHSCLSDSDRSWLTEHIAKAFCLALCPHLKLLKEDGITN